MWLLHRLGSEEGGKGCGVVSVEEARGGDGGGNEGLNTQTLVAWHGMGGMRGWDECEAAETGMLREKEWSRRGRLGSGWDGWMLCRVCTYEGEKEKEMG
jgi:hypothetical protein